MYWSKDHASLGESRSVRVTTLYGKWTGDVVTARPAIRFFQGGRHIVAHGKR